MVSTSPLASETASRTLQASADTYAGPDPNASDDAGKWLEEFESTEGANEGSGAVQIGKLSNLHMPLNEEYQNSKL
jgi:hypothetical protein